MDSPRRPWRACGARRPPQTRVWKTKAAEAVVDVFLRILLLAEQRVGAAAAGGCRTLKRRHPMILLQLRGKENQ